MNEESSKGPRIVAIKGSVRPGNFTSRALNLVVDEIRSHEPKIGRVFQLDDIVEAHRCMEDNTAGGKIVVLT